MMQQLRTWRTRERLIEADAAPDPAAVFRAGLTHRDPLLRHVSAIRLSELQPDALPLFTIIHLWMTLNNCCYGFRKVTPIAEAYAAVMPGRDLKLDIVRCIGQLRYSQFDRSELLIQRLMLYFSEDPNCYELAHAMLTVAFPKCAATLETSQITGLQHEVLRALTSNNQIWFADNELSHQLQERGIPTDRLQVTKLVNAAEQQPD